MFLQEHFAHLNTSCHPERSIAIGLTNRNAQSRDLLSGLRPTRQDVVA